VKRVAILGAGIMGSAVALFLSRRRARVTLFDAADEPFAGASRWNEGKIHLGYLYAADPSLETARRLLPGGLAFRRLTEELVGCSIDQAIAHTDDTFLIHRDSVTSAEAAAQYFDAVAVLTSGQATRNCYLVPVDRARPRRLTPSELEAEYDTGRIVAAFRVPERSISTRWVADRFVEALAGEPGVEQRMQTHVTSVRRATDAIESRLFVETSAGTEGPFDAVVNALWQGRLAIDATVDLPMPLDWSHRFRLSAFLRTSRAVDLPSTVIATGPFGDIKNYNGRDLYLSWYPSGLVVEGSAVHPPPIPPLQHIDRTRLVGEIVEQLGRFVPAVAGLHSCLEDARVEGGWVYAAGQGSLADPTATLHRRDRIGVTRAGSYISVDTGKYSIAPSLAREVAGLITQDA
jgi:glycine/D-amino acid oxidase-like deaminating enzyme